MINNNDVIFNTLSQTSSPSQYVCAIHYAALEESGFLLKVLYLQGSWKVTSADRSFAAAVSYLTVQWYLGLHSECIPEDALCSENYLNQGYFLDVHAYCMSVPGRNEEGFVL